MSDTDFTRRKRSVRGYPINLALLILAIGVAGLLWRLSDHTATPVSREQPTTPSVLGAAIDMATPETAASEILHGEALLGHQSSQERSVYDRCDERARLDMQGLIVRVSAGMVVVRRSVWDTKTTSTRVGIASWLSECTQDNQPVQIFGDQSDVPLATYGRHAGYRLPKEAR